MALPRPRMIAAGAALVLAFGAGWLAQGWRMGAEHAALEMRYATRLAQAQENALKEYARLEKVKDDAIREAEIEAEKNAAAAAAATRAADRLRGDVASLRASIAAAPRATIDQYADTAGELLGACAAEYQWMAEQADQHLVNERLLIGAWPRAN